MNPRQRSETNGPKMAKASRQMSGVDESSSEVGNMECNLHQLPACFQSGVDESSSEVGNLETETELEVILSVRSR